MGHSKVLPVTVLLLALATAAVWGLALWGVALDILGPFGPLRALREAPDSAAGDTPPPALVSPGVTPPDEPAATPTPNPGDQTAVSLQPEQIAGLWDITFRRVHATAYDGGWEVLGVDEVALWMEIEPAKYFEYVIMPTDATFNGVRDLDALAKEPVLFTGELDGNTLLLYLDIDDFYLEDRSLAVDTIEPGYLALPLTVQNGKLTGTYDFTWQVTLDGYDMQYRITFDAVQR